MEKENIPIIIDNGSSVCRVGFSGDDLPKASIPSVFGGSKDKIFIGKQALDKNDAEINYPILHGNITNWDDMEKIWSHCLSNELKMNSNEHSILMTEAPQNSKTNREKITEIMFETYKVPCFYLEIQSVLSLYSSGRTTEIGDGVTVVAPISNSKLLPNAIRKDFAGRDLTEYLIKLLSEPGKNSTSASEIAKFSDIKNKFCYIAEDFETEIKNFAESTKDNIEYKLPDGKILTVSNERFKCPEAIFNPVLCEFPGIHNLVYNSIMDCDFELRNELCKNIVISGGSTMLPGFPERFSKEIKNLFKTQNLTIKVIAPSDRINAVWVGGSILTLLGNFKDKWITRKEYEEFGPGIVSKKC